MKDYNDAIFERILSSYLLSTQILDWAKVDKMPDKAIDYP